MLTRSWIDVLKSRFLRTLNRHERRVSGRRGPEPRRLKMETLEDRRVLAFAAPVNYDVGLSPQAIVSDDFNNDTIPDLATANSSDSTVSVLLGDGVGGFGAKTDFPTGANPQSVAVGDFNDDGNMDLATANYSDVSVLLGDGAGAFGAPSSLGVAGNPQSVAVGDFNGDGTLDLGVTSNYYTPGYYYYYGYNTAYANVLLGTGDGGFSGPSATYIDSYAYANSALAADLNGDSYDDFVTFDSYGYVTVLVGATSGYLQVNGYFYTGDYSYAVAAGDVNGDLNTDLVAANFNGNTVGVLLGNGLGGFSGPVNYDAGGSPISIVLGDFTGDDGILDVATSNYYSHEVSVLYGDGSGTFAPPTLFATGSLPYSIVTGYFDGDTWLDAATANVGDDTVSVLINDTVWPAPPPPPPPTVSIYDTSISEGNTGTTSATFTIYLSKAYSQDVTVHYATADDTATAGSDYTGASGDVTITGGLGLTSQTFTIDVTGDRVWEPTETFAVNLSDPVNATIGDGQGIGTIYDDEPLISIDNVAVTEGTGTSSVNATFTVWLSDTSDVDVTVHYDLADGSATADDYTGGSGDVTIPANQYSQTFTVAVLGDRLAESTETYVVNLSAPVNAGIADNQGVGTILDNEPRLSINSVGKREGNGGTTQIHFTVSLSAAYDQPVTVNYATAQGTATEGSDYQAKSETLTFAPGVTSMNITIFIITDKVREANETFVVNLSEASSNSLISVAQGLGTIIDDDTRGKK